LAMGVHAGATGVFRAGGVRLSARGELRLGSDSYVPGWIGPLYEHDRRQLGDATEPGTPLPTQLERARAGGLGGLGALLEVGLRSAALVEARASYASRPGLPDVASARLSAPYLRFLQAGVWAATE